MRVMGVVKQIGGLVLLAGFALAQEEGDRNKKAVFPSNESYINFSFDAVGIPAFVRVVGEATGKTFVLGSGLERKITVISPKVRTQDVYPIFLSILESVDCSVVQDGDVLRVVTVADRPTLLGPIVGVGEATPEAGVVTKVYRIQHVSASELRKMLEPKVRSGKDGAVHAIDEINHLIVTDTAESVRKIDRLIDEIDLPGLVRMTEVVPLKFASAVDVAQELNEAIAETATRAERLRGRLARPPGSPEDARRQSVVVASPHANRLLLVGSEAQIEELKSIIAHLDVDTPPGQGRMNAIFLNYLSAEDVAKNLKSLLGVDGSSEEGQRRKHEIAIEADTVSRALLVDASPGDFEIVRKLMKQLDRAPLQVMIEVVIAEVTVGDARDIGVQMVGVDIPSKPGETVPFGSSTASDEDLNILNLIEQQIFPGGLTIGVAHGTSLDADGNVVLGYPGIISINAIKEDSRFNVRADPTLVTLDNVEASFSIVNDIPILTSVIEGGSGASRDVIQNIERMDVGIKLSLTPHVITNGFVNMDLNPSIQAVIDPGPEDTPFTPTIAKREASTSVIVGDGQMIVIAGLTREDKNETIRRIPILGSIPLLGWLFRRTIEVEEKTNLLIFVKPTILYDSTIATAATEQQIRSKGIYPNEE